MLDLRLLQLIVPGSSDEMDGKPTPHLDLCTILDIPPYQIRSTRMVSCQSHQTDYQYIVSDNRPPVRLHRHSAACKRVPAARNERQSAQGESQADHHAAVFYPVQVRSGRTRVCRARRRWVDTSSASNGQSVEYRPNLIPSHPCIRQSSLNSQDSSSCRAFSGTAHDTK